MAHNATRLGDSTFTEVESPLLVVPIGSCEQHGPHLPLDTDTRIALAIADGLGRADARVRITPAITIGASGEHAGFAGTLSIGTDALALVLVELVRSADWSSGVVFVNAHGGNVDAVQRAVDQLRGESRRAWSWWPRVRGGDAHAGRTETSLMLAIAPSTVRLDRAAAGAIEPIEELLSSLRDRGVVAVSPNGVLGDPAGASAAAGRELLACLVEDLVNRVREWMT